MRLPLSGLVLLCQCCCRTVGCLLQKGFPSEGPSRPQSRLPLRRWRHSVFSFSRFDSEPLRSIFMSDIVSVVVFEFGFAPSDVQLLRWKAIVAPQEQVQWQLKEPLLDMHRGAYDKCKFDVAAFLRRNTEVFQVLLTKAGVSLQDHVFPSRLSLARRSGEALPASTLERVRDEFTCSTTFVLVLLLWWSLGRRSCAERTASKRLLSKFLRGFVTELAAPTVLLKQAIAEFAPSCRAGADGDSPCSHLVEFRQGLLAFPPPPKVAGRGACGHLELLTGVRLHRVPGLVRLLRRFRGHGVRDG